MSIVIGVTGGYCTGKTTVRRALQRCGVGVVDLDALAHQTLKPNAVTFRKIVKTFGSTILSNGRISRQRLARMVFGNKARLRKLNAIIHPVVIKAMKRRIKALSSRHTIIAVEVPLLFEAHLERSFDYIIVVVAKRAIQIKRATKKTGARKGDIVNRINSQLSLKKKAQKADFVVDNNGKRAEVYAQTKNIVRNLKNKK